MVESKKKRVKWTTTTFGEYVKNETEGKYLLKSDYKTGRDKVLIEHTICQTVYPVTPSNFIKGSRCAKCANRERKTTEQFKQEVFDKYGEEYTVIGEYVNGKTKVKVRHSCGFEYKVLPSNILRGRRCSKCFGHAVDHTNSLGVKYPDLLKEWDYEENESIDPFKLREYSNKAVGWICKEGHKWRTSVSHRTKGETGCPVCSGNKVLKGYNDIETTDKYLLKDWNYDKNIVKPDEISIGYSTKVWWRCENGHDWEATPLTRKKGHGCPYCETETHGASKPTKGVNDLETLYPELIAEWDYEENEKEPSEYLPGSGARVSWVCKENHKWVTPIASRTSGTNCPVCANQKVVKGCNDLETTHPEVAKFWNHNKNRELKPSDVTYGSEKRVHFICELGHEWNTAVLAMTNSERGCPVCSGRKAWPGFNDLATQNPELAKEWHPTKNGDLKPTEVTKGSNKKVWWLCSNCGREWEATVSSRNSGNGCSRCNQSKGEKHVKQCLDRHNLLNEQQYRFSDCKNKKELPFDSAVINEVGDILCLIEFDGEQHFRPVKAFGGKKAFKKTKENDTIKTQYCQDHHITLIRIPYWLRDHVDEVLTYWLKHYQIIA